LREGNVSGMKVQLAGYQYVDATVCHPGYCNFCMTVQQIALFKIGEHNRTGEFVYDTTVGVCMECFKRIYRGSLVETIEDIMLPPGTKLGERKE
jgi:hypothetical protein